MKTIRQVGRDVFARALRVFIASHVRQALSPALAALALAGAMLLASFSAAQAQTATTTQLISAPNPSPAGEDVTFSATVVPAVPGAQSPSGTVTFLDNGTAIGTGVLIPNGSDSVAAFATGTLPSGTLSVGTHTITTSYLGDSNFSGSSGGPLSQVINKNDTKTLIIASPNPSTTGQQVTFTATVTISTGTGTLTPGTVTFNEGSTVLGTASINNAGVATFTTSALTSGSHSITAAYSGNASFSGSTSAALVEQIGPPADSIKLRQMQVSTTPAHQQGLRRRGDGRL